MRSLRSEELNQNFEFPASDLWCRPDNKNRSRFMGHLLRTSRIRAIYRQGRIIPIMATISTATLIYRRRDKWRLSVELHRKWKKSISRAAGSGTVSRGNRTSSTTRTAPWKGLRTLRGTTCKLWRSLRPRDGKLRG